MTRLVFVALAMLAGSSLCAQRPLPEPHLQKSVVSRSSVRNPPFLRASEILGRGTPGEQPRIRFEWEQVPGCTAYVLAGQWTDNQSWAVRTLEYRVTDRNATSWTVNHVTFDGSLARGSHSWKLIAVFGPDETGDFENPAHVSFNVR